MRARMSETELAMAMQEQAAANQARQEAIASAVGGAVNLGIGLSTGAVSDFKKQFGIGQGGSTPAVAPQPVYKTEQSSAPVVSKPYDPNAGDAEVQANGYTPSYIMGVTTNGANISLDYRKQAEQTITENYLDYYNKYFGNG